MPRKLKQMCASLVHRELLLESLQQEKSSSALSGAQSHKCLNYDWTTKFIFCPLEQNLIGAKMPWSEGAQSRANKHSCSVNLVKSQSGRERHLQLSAGSILSKHPSHAWQADWYIMSLKTTLAWSVQDLAVVWTCISSSPSAAQTSELGDLRSTSQRDHELRQLLTGIFESTRRNQHAAPLHHCTTLLCRCCLRQRSVDLSLLLLSSLHLQHINVTNSENQNSEWNYDELMNSVFSIPHSVQLGVST